jgi:hypothetical protein
LAVSDDQEKWCASLSFGFVMSVISMARDQEVAGREYSLSNTPFGD